MVIDMGKCRYKKSCEAGDELDFMPRFMMLPLMVLSNNLGM